MKHLSEYRDAEIVKRLLGEIRSMVTRQWKIMEICGGQTHSLVKNGILGLLPEEVVMVHGPGCPVCVTPLRIIDKAVELAESPGVILCSFGDMIRVPGSRKSLLEAKADGADIRILYSPIEAVAIAKAHPDKQVVFFAVGFETTAPANALSVIQAYEMGLKNYSILTSHVLVPPAIEAILDDEFSSIQGFLAAGHVCTIMGTDEYVPLIEKYKIPIVVTGFEPVDLLAGIKTVVELLESGKAELVNEYARVVRGEGNKKAQEAIFEVFEIGEREWRGIGPIPESGYTIRSKYMDYDADRKFSLKKSDVVESPLCIAGEILKGNKKPFQCSAFGKECTPQNPLGAPMVSSEGACAAYYHYAQIETT